MSREAARRALALAFSEAGLPSAALDARVLLENILGITSAERIARPDMPLTPIEAARVEEAARRRLAREPVARILGWREFWGLDFVLGPDTLVPRPETEILVEAVLKNLREAHPAGAPLRFLDLGTGTGCILIALLKEWPAAHGIGLDRAEGAARIARANAARLGVGGRVAFAVGDWAQSLHGRFDVVVSNPPYIRSGDITGLEPEVRTHDPVLALDGDEDGLSAYRAIAADLPQLLAPRGVAALELGAGQAQDVAGLLQHHGLDPLPAIPDLAGIARVVMARARQ